jgi:hypothetical protein
LLDLSRRLSAEAHAPSADKEKSMLSWPTLVWHAYRMLGDDAIAAIYVTGNPDRLRHVARQYGAE